MGLSLKNARNLQLVQNAVAQAVFGISHDAHIILLFLEIFQWLSVGFQA